MKTKGKTHQPASKSVEQQLAGFIGKFDAKNQALIRAVRRSLHKSWPATNELVWDNYNFFVIGYSPTERPSDTFVSIAAASNGIGLAFYYGAKLPDPHHLLQGSGKQNRFLRFDSPAVLERPEV